MEIVKNINEEGCYDVVCDENNKKFSMIYGGDGDLYWTIYKNDDLATSEITFNITKEYYYLYQSFYELYKRVENCEVFDFDPLEEILCDDEEERTIKKQRSLQHNEFLKETENYSLLFSDGVIIWHSDDDYYEDASVVEIRKNEEDFSLTFRQGKYDDEFNSVSIRFRNSGSSYIPFNILFMDMYNCVKDYDFECYQMHIEECMYRQKMKVKEI